MRWADRLRVRLRSLSKRGRIERELDAELRFHLDQQIGENIAAGMDCGAGTTRGGARAGQRASHSGGVSRLAGRGTLRSGAARGALRSSLLVQESWLRLRGCHHTRPRYRGERRDLLCRQRGVGEAAAVPRSRRTCPHRSRLLKNAGPYWRTVAGPVRCPAAEKSIVRRDRRVPDDGRRFRICES
jgi:hypothetical protein